MIPDIAFKNIVPRGGSQTTAFEELCTQLARKTVEVGETFERYRGDGGDGGVECIVRKPDKSVIGWQSKFVTDVDGLIKQAGSSLETAVKIHPTLKKYVVCFPFDLTGRTGHTTRKGQPAQSGTDKVNAWIDASLAKYKGSGAALEEIDIWPANKLAALMLEHDPSAGMRNYFFSEAGLPLNWFEKNLITSIKKAGPRYNPELSVETAAWKYFAAFGQTENWDKIIGAQIGAVTKELKTFKSDATKRSKDPVFPGLADKFRPQAEAIASDVNTILAMLSGVLTDDLLKKSEEQISSVIGLLSRLDEAQVNDLNVRYKDENWDTKTWRNFMQEYMVSFPCASLDHARDMLAALKVLSRFIQSAEFRLVSQKTFVLSGIGGSGKTHCICDVAKQRLKNNLLSCIVFGDQFAGNPDEWTRFGEALGIKGLTSDQLLDALNSAGEQSGKPLIIFLDAINETIPRNYWVNKILAFAGEVEKRPFLKLSVSCRTSFLQTCLPEKHGLLVIEHVGFKGMERDACNAFFNFYGLNPPLIPILQPELSNPLYLKLVCSTLQAKGLNDLPTGWNGLLPVIKAFLQEKEKQLCHRYDLSTGGALVAISLTSIIQEISNKVGTSLSWTDATTAIAKNTPALTAHDLLDWLVKADLLIEDGAINNDDLISQTYVRPAFERLGDFLLAAEIAKKGHAEGTGSFLSHPKVSEILRDENSIKNNASLVAALSVIVPETYGTELPEMLSHTATYVQVSIIATGALIWRTAESLSEDTREFVDVCLANDGYIAMDALFSICTQKSSLDALALNNILQASKLPARDAFFLPYLYTTYNESGIVARLIEAYVDIDLAAISDDMAFRWVIALTWLTASADRRIKDKATRAAIAILQHHNNLANKLIDQFVFLVNDEEVIERLLLIIYAAQILNPEKATLAVISERLVNLYTNNTSAFENALIRDHIRCIAELAAYLKCLHASVNPLDLKKSDVQEDWNLALPDENLIRGWQNEGGARRRLVRSAVGDDFNHYSINCVSRWMGDLSKKDVGNWIVADVVERKGLSNKLHDAYDENVSRETGGGRSKPPYAERIGKKYQWNALYRLASILHDNVKAENSYSEPDPERQPLILQEERKLDPTLTNWDLVKNSNSKNWWLAKIQNLDGDEKLNAIEWLKYEDDIPQIEQIVNVTAFKDQNWLPLSGSFSVDTQNKNQEFGMPYRLLNIFLNSYLVRNADIEKVIAKLRDKDIYSDSLPSSGTYSHCYLGEYPWGTACNTEPDWYLGVGDKLDKSRLEMHNTVNNIAVEWEYDATLQENIHLEVPSKRFFGPDDLWWNGKDGYKRADGKTVFKDPRIETGGRQGMVADVDDLQSRLADLNYGIVWVLTGEKLLINDDENNKGRLHFTQICWMSNDGKLHFEKRSVRYHKYR